MSRDPQEPGSGMVYEIKDSGERTEFTSGMVRDSCPDKLDYTSLLFGPMLDRYIAHLTKGRQKYPDPEPGVPNWTLASGKEELIHAQRSLLRHVFQLLRGETDEDHAAAVWFNVNLIEYVREKMSHGETSRALPPGAVITTRPGQTYDEAVEEWWVQRDKFLDSLIGADKGVDNAARQE